MRTRRLRKRIAQQVVGQGLEPGSQGPCLTPERSCHRAEWALHCPKAAHPNRQVMVTPVEWTSVAMPGITLIPITITELFYMLPCLTHEIQQGGCIIILQLRTQGPVKGSDRPKVRKPDQGTASTCRCQSSHSPSHQLMAPSAEGPHTAQCFSEPYMWLQEAAHQIPDSCPSSPFTCP